MLITPTQLNLLWAHSSWSWLAFYISMPRWSSMCICMYRATFIFISFIALLDIFCTENLVKMFRQCGNIFFLKLFYICVQKTKDIITNIYINSKGLFVYWDLFCFIYCPFPLLMYFFHLLKFDLDWFVLSIKNGENWPLMNIDHIVCTAKHLLSKLQKHQ